METKKQKKVVKKKPKMGRPTKYDKKYIKKVAEYLKNNKDIIKKVVKYQGEKSTGYEEKIIVKLPTISGFSLLINIPEKTVYAWADKYPNFRKSLDEIKEEQKKRLINSGLSGEYNSTIAKLILSSNHGMREKTDIGIEPGEGLGLLILPIRKDGDNKQPKGSVESDS